MGRILKPMVRGGGWYPSKKWIPLVKNGGYTTQNGGETEPVWATVSGAIASFTTPFAYPLKKLVAQINPVQDLHGQSNPWPAGGGKNKVDFGTIAPATTNYPFRFPTPIPAGSYVLSFDVADLSWPSSTDTFIAWIGYESNQGNMYFSEIKRVSDNASLKNLAQPVTGRFYVTVTTNEDGLRLTIAFRSDSYKSFTSGTMSNIMLEAGTAPTDFAPYENICPISGHTGAEVYDDPAYGGLVNWNQQVQNGNFAETTRWGAQGGAFAVANNIASFTASMQYGALVSGPIPLVSGHKYLFLSSIKSNGGSTNVKVYFGSYIAGQTRNIGETWTDDSFIQICSRDGNGSLYFQNNDASDWKTLDIRNACLFDLTQMFGTTVADYIYNLEQTTAGAGIAWFRNLFPKDYYSYNAGEETTVSAVNGDPYEEFSVSFGRTVYGGTDEVVSGELTSTHDLYNLRNYAASRINTYDYNGKHGVYFQYGYSITADRDSGLCNVAVVSTTADNPASQYMWFGVNSNHVFWIGILDALGMTLEEFKTWITQNDVIITRRLATPQSFTHDGQSVDTLVGQNNIWTTTGDVEVTYRIE